MSMNLSSDIQDKIDTAILTSLQAGRSVRRRNMLWSGLSLAGSLFILIVSGASTAVFIAVMLAVSTLCIVWALMSMSASLNMQFDALMVLLDSCSKRVPRNDEKLTNSPYR